MRERLNFLAIRVCQTQGLGGMMTSASKKALEFAAQAPVRGPVDMI
jgi:hypothetical protein